MASNQHSTFLGIDEAGYGPTLGPLVSVACRLVSTDPGRDIWAKLSPTVARAGEGAGSLRVCDSKALYTGSGGFRRLELTALAFAAAATGAVPGSLGELLDQLGVEPSHLRKPWYAGGLSLPRSADSEEVSARSKLLREALDRADLSELAIFANVTAAAAFNRGVRRLGNKASLHLDTVLHLLAESRGAGGFSATVDRLGGRKHYAAALGATFGVLVQTLREEAQVSSYRLPALKGEVRFEVKADASDFLVALASIFAKYLRELHMECLNRYFCARIAGLKPTAGYPGDARRFLSRVGPCLEKWGILRSDFIRSR